MQEHLGDVINNWFTVAPLHQKPRRQYNTDYDDSSLVLSVVPQLH